MPPRGRRGDRPWLVPFRNADEGFGDAVQELHFGFYHETLVTGLGVGPAQDPDLPGEVHHTIQQVDGAGREAGAPDQQEPHRFQFILLRGLLLYHFVLLG